MEPTIYKPSAYNTPGIYKGAGGIYKGRGVYNDGAGYNGPFVLLNNCDNINSENVCNSLIGSNLSEESKLPFGYLINSNIFPGSRSIKRNNSKYVVINNIDVNDVFTIEIYISSIAEYSMGGTDFYAMTVFCGSTASGNKFRIGGPNIYDIETSYPVADWGLTYKAILIDYVTNAHFAAVINKNEKKVYCFVNGLKIGSYKYIELGRLISQNGPWASAVLEFFCVRNGDFSNNLNSFNVPTQKYNL